MRLRRFFQFRLRTLVLLISAIAIVLGWWLRPYRVEGVSSDGSITGAYRLRRGLLGGEVAHGTQLRRMLNGQTLRWKQWSGLPDPDASSAYAHEYVLIDGRLASKEEWNAELNLPDFDQLVDLIRPLFTPEEIAAAVAAQEAAQLVEAQETTQGLDQAGTEMPRDGVTNSLGMRLVAIPPGEFLMGAPEDDTLAKKDEKPSHRVRITRGFYMAAHEVTVGQFRSFVAATGFKTAAETDGRGSSGYEPERRGFEYDSPKYSWRVTGYSQDDKHPVVNVNWHDAQAFCKWLTKKEGRSYRLPTEAEWEYACRAGSSKRFVTDDAVRGLRPAANLCDESLKKQWDTSTVKKYGLDPTKIEFAAWDDGHAFTAPVGSYKPNALGLYDMLGNAGEFCGDGYDADYYAASPEKDPAGPAKETKGHVVRGGTFLNDARLVRVSARVECPDKYCNYVIGFRVVRE